MANMDKTQKIEEVLGLIWEEKEKNNLEVAKIKELTFKKIPEEEILEELIKEGYISLEKDKVKFTPFGEAKAKDIIRRQRLAERLLLDVLEVGREEMVSSACEFEHIISREVE
ncbi:MAG: hypothetical protein N2Z79_01015, partial [Candidatus Omnitrophica bacterium]|nr:hypothetical protein [Candidatus Omnitrophota bacterium]